MLRESHRPGIEPTTCKSQVQRPTAEITGRILYQLGLVEFSRVSRVGRVNRVRIRVSLRVRLGVTVRVRVKLLFN